MLDGEALRGAAEEGLGRKHLDHWYEVRYAITAVNNEPRQQPCITVTHISWVSLGAVAVLKESGAVSRYCPRGAL